MQTNTKKNAILLAVGYAVVYRVIRQSASTVPALALS